MVSPVRVPETSVRGVQISDQNCELIGTRVPVDRTGVKGVDVLPQLVTWRDVPTILLIHPFTNI